MDNRENSKKRQKIRNVCVFERKREKKKKGVKNTKQGAAREMWWQ